MCVVLFLSPLWLLLIPGLSWIPGTQVDLAQREWRNAWATGENSRSRGYLDFPVDDFISTTKTPREQLAKLFGPVDGLAKLDQVMDIVRTNRRDPFVLAAGCRVTIYAMKKDYKSLRDVGGLRLFPDLIETKKLAAQLLNLATQGRTIDPQNAYFPLMQAVALDVLGRRSERNEALAHAVHINRCDSYALAMGELRKQLLDEQHPYRGAAEEFLRIDFSNSEMLSALRYLLASLILEGPSGLASRRNLAICSLTAALDPSSKYYDLSFVMLFEKCLRSLPLGVDPQGISKPNIGDAFGWELTAIGLKNQASVWSGAYNSVATARRNYTNRFQEMGFSDPLILNYVLVIWWIPITLLYIALAWVFSHFKLPNFPFAMHPGLIAAGLCTTVVLSATYDVNTISEFSLFAYVAGSILVLMKGSQLFGWLIGPSANLTTAFFMKDVDHVDWFLSLSALVLYGVLAIRYFWQSKHQKEGWLVAPGLLSSVAVMMAFLMVQPIPWQSGLTALLELIGIALFFSGWQQITVRESFARITRCWPLLLGLTGFLFIAWSLSVKYFDHQVASAYEVDQWSKDDFLSEINTARSFVRSKNDLAGEVIPKLRPIFKDPQWRKLRAREAAIEASDRISESRNEAVSYEDVVFSFGFASVDSAAAFLNWVQCEGLAQSSSPSQGRVQIQLSKRADLKLISAATWCLYWVAKLAGGTMTEWQGKRKVIKDIGYGGGF